MRLLIDAVAASASGAGLIRTRELARTLPRLRPEHELVFVVRPELVPVVQEFAPHTRIVSPPAACRCTPGRLLWEHLALPRVVRSFQPEVVFSPFNVVPTAWPKPRPALAVMVSNLAPYSTLVRQMARPRERLRNAFLKAMTNRSVARADHVFLQSSQAYPLIGTSRLAFKAQVVSPAPAPLVQGEGSDLPVPAGRYFIVVSDFYKFKGIETAVSALSLLNEEPDAKLVICGRPLERDYLEALEKQIDRLDLRERVRLQGALRHDQVLALMRHAVGCIAPSRFENLSKVPAEAMSVDTPVVVSDIPSYREACGSATLYFEAGDAQGLAGQMALLLNDTAVRERLVSRGRSLLESLDSVEAASEMMEALERLNSKTSDRAPDKG